MKQFPSLQQWKEQNKELIKELNEIKTIEMFVEAYYEFHKAK
jgi:hypothetical protein